MIALVLMPFLIPFAGVGTGAAGAAHVTGPQLSSSEARFIWPLDPAPEVVRPFDRPTEHYGPGHRGVDLEALPAQSVLAAGTGVVVFAGTLAGRGVVSIDHDGGLRTTYEPVRPLVTVGDQVYAGQEIGTVDTGHSGCAGSCLHWGVRRGSEYLNPLTLVGERIEVWLKPWDG